MKLFGKGGKLNIIDLLIIVILLAALVFVGMKFLKDEPETLGSENALTEPNLRLTVLCEGVDAQLAENIMQALEGENVTVAGNEVTQRRLFYSNKLVDGQVTGYEIKENPDGTVDLYFHLEAAAVISSGAYSVALQDVRLGKEFVVKTLDVEIEGLVFFMEKLG